MLLIYVCVNVYERKLLISYCHDNEEADDTLMTEKFFLPLIASSILIWCVIYHKNRELQDNSVSLVNVSHRTISVYLKIRAYFFIFVVSRYLKQIFCINTFDSRLAFNYLHWAIINTTSSIVNRIIWTTMYKPHVP